MQDINVNNGNIIRMSVIESRDIHINYNIYDTRYGKTLIASTEKGVCFIALGEEPFMIEELKREYPKALFKVQNDDYHNLTISEVENPTSGCSIPFHIKGTDFQIKVWSELLKIELGSKCNYKQIAENIGRPKAVRAVGTAVGQNPISCLIPCHRVIRSDNTLGGYHWGLDVKRMLLELESSI